MARILGQEGAIARVSGMFFKYVVHAVLLLGSNTWVENPRMGRALGSFQPRFAMHITGRHPRRQVGGIWEYLLLETEMEEAGFEDMGVYVLKRQSMVAQYIATWPILDPCEETVRITGEWVARGW